MSVKPSEINLGRVVNFTSFFTGLAVFSLLATQLLLDFSFHDISVRSSRGHTFVRLLILYLVLQVITQTGFVASTYTKCNMPSIMTLRGPIIGAIVLVIFAFSMQTWARKIGFFKNNGWFIFGFLTLAYIGFYTLYPILKKEPTLSWWNTIPPSSSVLLYAIYGFTLEPMILNSSIATFLSDKLGFLSRILYIIFIGGIIYLLYFPYVYGSSFIENEEKICLSDKSLSSSSN